jgi:hypothetical protein
MLGREILRCPIVPGSIVLRTLIFHFYVSEAGMAQLAAGLQFLTLVMNDFLSWQMLHKGVTRIEILKTSKKVDFLTRRNARGFQVIEIRCVSRNVLTVSPHPRFFLSALFRERNIVVRCPKVCANQAPARRQNENAFPVERICQLLVQFAKRLFGVYRSAAR